jgi:hypothetical protein
MDLPPVIGQIRFVRDEYLIEGWCWSPDSPQARQVVEVFLDGAFVVAIVAGWLDPRLEAAKVGDGRHGFALTLSPEDPLAYRTITARDRQSGHVFAAIDCDAGGAIDPFSCRVDHLADVIPQLTALAEEQPLDEPTDLRRPLRELGYRLTARARTRPGTPGDPATVPLGALRQRLAEHCHGTRLPAVAHPRTSIVFQARSAAATASSIARIAPALAELQAEVVIVDNGHDPLCSLLPSLLRNLRTVFDRDAVSSSETGNLGAAQARGDLLVFLDCGAVPASAAALVELVATADAEPGLVMGQRRLDPLHQLDLAEIAGAQRSRVGGAPLGLNLCLRHELFMDLGQFEPGLADAPGLECADLFLKAALLGTPTTIWRDPPRALTVQPEAWEADQDVDASRMLHALAAFRTRWRGEVPRSRVWR